jgi:hypothetical protein
LLQSEEVIMMGVETAAPRDTAGRWVPGRSGNPAGKRPGTRNRATLLRAALRDGEDEAAARVLIDKAVDGNLVAARYLLDAIAPKPRGRPIELELAPDADPVEALEAIMRAMVTGEVSPDEALLMSRLLQEQLGRRAAAAARLAESAARAAEPVAPAVTPAAGAARPKPPLRRPTPATAAAPAFALHRQAPAGAPSPGRLTASLLASSSLTPPDLKPAAAPA